MRALGFLSAFFILACGPVTPSGVQGVRTRTDVEGLCARLLELPPKYQQHLDDLIELCQLGASDQPTGQDLPSLPSTLRVVALDDGRTMKLETFGPDHGHPVVFFHGTPGGRQNNPARVPAKLEAVEKLNIRLISIDRHGYGGTSPVVADSFERFAGDIEQVLDALGLSRVSFVGVSGGGAFALACGYYLPLRTDRVVPVSSVVPPESGLLEQLDEIDGAMIWLVDKPLGFQLVQRIGQAFPAIAKYPALMNLMLPEVDRQVADQPHVGAMLASGVASGIRGGAAHGFATDYLLFGQSWNFALTGYPAPVELWQGDADETVPPALGHYLADALQLPSEPQPATRAGQAHFVDGTGHLLFVDRWEEILRSALPLHLRPASAR